MDQNTLIEVAAKGIFTGIAYGFTDDEWDQGGFAEQRGYCLNMATDAVNAIIEAQREFDRLYYGNES